jgi:hypothetical protein
MLLLTLGLIIGIVIAAVIAIIAFIVMYYLKKDSAPEKFDVYYGPYGARGGTTTDMQQRFRCYPRDWGTSSCYMA